MALFRKAFEKRSIVYSTVDEDLAKILGVQGYGVSSEKAKEATFYTCLRILSDTVSKLPLKLYQETNNSIEKATDNYLYNMLKLRPNPYMSSSVFWKVVEFQRNYFGHCAVYIDAVKTGKNAGTIRGLYPLDTEKLEVWEDDAGIIGKQNAIWYLYTTRTGRFKFKKDQVLHFLGMTRDGLVGMPIKDYLQTIVENAQSGQQYVNNYFSNGLFSRAVLNYTGDISPEKQKSFQQRVQNMSNGIQNAGSVLPVPIGFEVKPLNASMADSQFLELNKLSIQQIAAAFGIKLHQVNELDRATHTNIAEQQKEFYIDTLQSILNMYEQELSYKLLTTQQQNNGYFFKFNVDAILRADIKTRYDAYGVGIDKGFLTPNEVRQMEDKPWLPGGDELIVNGNMQKVQDVGAYYKNQPSSDPTKGGDNNGKDQSASQGN